MTLTAPVQDATVTLVDESGIAITRQFSNQDTDVLTFTESGPDTPATSELKLHLTSAVPSKAGLDPAGYFDADDYFLDVEISGLEMRDASDTTFTRLSGAFSAEDPGIYVYLMAGIVGEANRSAVANFALSRASSTDVTATYELTSGTATQGVDFEGSTVRLRSVQERCVLQHRSANS